MATQHQFARFTKAFHSYGAPRYPVTTDGFWRADFRALFAEYVAHSGVPNNPATQQALAREWPRMSASEQKQVVLGATKTFALANSSALDATDWLLQLLLQNAQLQDPDAMADLILASSEWNFSDALARCARVVAALSADSPLLAATLKALHKSRVLQEAKTFSGIVYHSEACAALLVKLLPCRQHHQPQYDETVYFLLRGYITHCGDTLALSRFIHAGIPVDPITTLQRVMKERGESVWPAVLSHVSLWCKDAPQQQQSNPNQPRVCWDPQWRNVERACQLAELFLSSMEAKRNRNAREEFAGAYLQQLMQHSDVVAALPDFANRAGAVWLKNIDPAHTATAAQTLCQLWPTLAEDQRQLYFDTLIYKMPPPTEASELNRYVATITSMHAAGVAPAYLDALLPRFTSLIPGGSSTSRPTMTLPAHAATILPIFARSETGAALVAQWLPRLLQHALNEVEQGRAEALSYWLYGLSGATDVLPLLHALQKHEVLAEVTSLFTLSLLTDELFEVRPQTQALDAYCAFQGALGRTTFHAEFTAAYDQDVGVHPFGTLLRVVSPKRGAGVWSTLCALYGDDIDAGTLLHIPEAKTLLQTALTEDLQETYKDLALPELLL